jgi:hypothetical protein
MRITSRCTPTLGMRKKPVSNAEATLAIVEIA